MYLQSLIAAAGIILSIAKPAFASTGGDAAAWSYRENDGDSLGPSEWGEGYPICNGNRQSPIDITKSNKSKCEVEKDLPLSFSGDCLSFGLKMYEETFKWEATDTTCKIHRGDHTFSLAQFHMHMPSEHTLNGKTFDGEAHFVHKQDGGDELLVVGLFLQKHPSASQTPNNGWMNAVWNTLTHVNQTVEVEHSYADLLEEQIHEGHVFNYPGSLTTPPCSETVDWWVIQKALTVTEESLENFKNMLAELEATDDGDGARPVQSLNGREVVKY